jgi:hypothetical protein
MTSAADVAALRLQVLDGGWNPVPVSPLNKACYVAGWPKIETSEYHIANWSRTNPAHTNTGFVCNRNYFAVDADVLDADLAAVIRTIAFQKLGWTPFVRVGLAPKFLLVYRKADCDSVKSVGFKFEGRGDDGLEILSANKIFTAFGIHPKTGREYIWIGGANPLEDTPDEAPLVTQDQIDAFLEAVRAVIPFTVGLDGTARPDTPRSYNNDGLVTDGRENLLRDCIFQAAHEIHSAGHPLTARGVAGRGWELFAERAYLGDGEWSDKDALAKASSTVRRIREGRVKLEAALPAAQKFFKSQANKLDHVRQLLAQALNELSLLIYQLIREPAYAN